MGGCVENRPARSDPLSKGATMNMCAFDVDACNGMRLEYSSSAHMFIVAPLLSGSDLAGLFSTHPPIAKRIERLIGRDHV